jgi:hypothetical protein
MAVHLLQCENVASRPQKCLRPFVKYVSPPSAWEGAAYDPITNLPHGGPIHADRRTPPNGTVFYNFDCYNNWPSIHGVPVTITPTPPQPVKRVGSLWCSSIPAGAEFEIVTL